MATRTQTETKAAEVETARPEAKDQAAAKTVEPTVDEATAKALADRVLKARAIPGCSREVLGRLADLTPAKLWRVEQGRVQAAEVQALVIVLDALDEHGLPAEYRPKAKAAKAGKAPTRAELADRLVQVTALLRGASEAKTLKDKNAAIADALDAATGVDAGETAPEGAGATETA